MQLTFDIEPGDVRLWSDEAAENIEAIESGLLRLEKGETDPDVINRVFRGAHTLKGNSNAIGHKRMGALTHAMEDVFGALRAGQIPELGDLADPLFQTLDVLRALLDEVTAGETLADPAALTAELRTLLAAATSLEATVAAVEV